jgi:U4/U6 small nuclear ribonucleoprotein PRP3
MGFRYDPQFAPLINMFPGHIVTPDVTIPQKPTKVPVLRLDAHGREIDEHGNVVNVTKPSNLSTLKVCSFLNCLFIIYLLSLSM